MNDYCRNKAAPDGSAFYYACLYQSPESRQRLYALFALYYELLEGVLTASDPGVCRMKLEWWREELARLGSGRPRHPVGEALQPLLEENVISPAPLVALPRAVEALLSMPATDTDGWHQVRSVGAFWQCAAIAAGPATAAEQELAATTGIAVARLELLQNLRHLLSLGFNPLPPEQLEQAGLTGEDLMQDPASDATHELCASLVASVRQDLDTGYRQTGGRPAAHQLFVLIMNRLALATCREIHHDGDRLFSHKVALTPIRKFLIAWRTKYARLLKSY